MSHESDGHEAAGSHFVEKDKYLAKVKITNRENMGSHALVKQSRLMMLKNERSRRVIPVINSKRKESREKSTVSSQPVVIHSFNRYGERSSRYPVLMSIHLIPLPMLQVVVRSASGS